MGMGASSSEFKGTLHWNVGRSGLLTRPGTATPFSLRLRLHYKVAHAGGVRSKNEKDINQDRTLNLVLFLVSWSQKQWTRKKYNHYQCSGSMIPDTNVGGNIATINEVSDDQKATFFFS